MQIAEFKYTDAKKKVTERTVLVLDLTDEKLMGIDMGELDADAQVAFSNTVNTLDTNSTDFNQQLLDTCSSYDLKHKLRMFLVRSIQELVLEEI